MRPELLALMFGALIGCMALIAAGIRNISTRKQNRISVRPSLRIERNVNKDQPIKIIIQNCGMGTAYIDKFEIQVDDILISGEYKNGMDRIINLLGLNGLDIMSCFLNNGDELEVNETIILFEANPINSNDYEKIYTALQRLKFKIMYSSVYNETFAV